MDFVKNLAGGGDGDKSNKDQKSSESGSGGGGGFLSGIGNKLNAAAGGGPESEKNEDYLDKGEHGLSSEISGWFIAVHCVAD